MKPGRWKTARAAAEAADSVETVVAAEGAGVVSAGEAAGIERAMAVVSAADAVTEAVKNPMAVDSVTAGKKTS